MTKTLLLVLAVLFGAATAEAQQTVTVPVPSFPWNISGAWDDTNPAGTVLSWAAAYDSSTATVIPGVPTPCTSCATVSLPQVQGPSTHVFSVVTVGTNGLSSAAYTLTATFVLGSGPVAPSGVSNLRIIPSSTPPAPQASPIGTIAPPATQVTDSALHVWTIGPQVTCSSTSYPANHCYNLLKDGVYAGAIGYKIKRIGSDPNKVAVLGQENIWYVGTGPGTWVSVGATEPN